MHLLSVRNSGFRNRPSDIKPPSDHLVAEFMLPLSNRFLTVKGFTVSDS